MYDPATGYPGAVVELAYRDVAGALGWLERVFGLRPLLWQPADGLFLHAEVGTEYGGIVMLRRASADRPAPCRGTACKQVLVWVSDIESHHARAMSQGAEIVQAPATKPYGLRQYLVRDREGHLWEFTQHVRDVPPEAWGAVTPPRRRSAGVDEVVDNPGKRG